ncbi:UNVERIFIED_CONTAM: hypothetical protein FKN15_000676, partial [Acipenser sinensis]
LVDGKWTSWVSWAACSVSCGGGTRQRTRACASPSPQYGGRQCEGNDVHIDFCNSEPCPMHGNWGPWQDWSECTVSCGAGERTRIRLCNNPPPTNEGRSCPGDTSQVSRCNIHACPGEILRMTHIARGLDSDGALLLDIVVNGYILQLPSSAEISVKDYTEDYIHTGAGQLYAYSTRMFSIDKVSVPYSWNHTITYETSRGRMPFLVETLHASSITAQYHPLEETLEYKIHATIAKGDRSNQCPNGFRLDSAGPYCADEDECTARNPCSHTCHNAIGTYYCSCPRGLTISADGRTCQGRTLRKMPQSINTKVPPV